MLQLWVWSSKDTRIASQLAVKAGIPFINVELNDKYVSESSLDCGKEFIKIHLVPQHLHGLIIFMPLKDFQMIINIL